MAVSRNGLIAGLDVGSSKVCCFIARADGGTLRVIGIGHQLSRGLRSGNVIDMEAAEGSIRAAVETAERMCGETIRDVFVSISAGNPQSHTMGVEMAIDGHEVSDADVARVLEQGRRMDQPGDREILHSIPVGYTIDGSRGIKEPRGMAAERLGVNMHVITAASGPLRNLATCVARGHLRLSGRVIAPFASGLACLVEDEMDLGVTLIDMGGGTTSLAVFYDGQLVHADVVPLGGAHVTNDIARGLSTPLAHAERLKTLYGTVLPSQADENEMIDVPQVGETEEHAQNPVPRSILTGIIKPQVEEFWSRCANNSSLPDSKSSPVAVSCSLAAPVNFKACANWLRARLTSRFVSVARSALADWPRQQAARPSRPAPVCSPMPCRNRRSVSFVWRNRRSKPPVPSHELAAGCGRTSSGVETMTFKNTSIHARSQTPLASKRFLGQSNF